MSEKDSNIVVFPMPATNVVIADAKAIQIPPIEGDRKAYRRTMAAYEMAIASGAKMNPEDIIGAAKHRGDPLQNIEVDARIMNAAVGIRDYPDGSFTGVFKGEKRVIISGELQAPNKNGNELIPTSSQIVPTQTNLVSTNDQEVATADVVKGIHVFSSDHEDLDRLRENIQFLNPPLKKAA